VIFDAKSRDRIEGVPQGCVEGGGMSAEVITFPARHRALPSAGHPGSEGVAFGSFRLWSAERRLEKAGHPVPLGGRALDILLVLIERPGEVVSKQELMRRVWPGIAVEESNLRVNIASLRKALGESETARFIGSVAGRGYCFVAPVSLVREAASNRDEASVLAPAGCSVEQLLQLISTQLSAGKFVHIVLSNAPVLRVEGEDAGPMLAS
jgi:DNA-binding winged helix-turn-helix (wHTH) protein